MNPNVVLCVVVYVVTIALGVAWYVLDGSYTYNSTVTVRVNRVTGASCSLLPAESGWVGAYRWSC